MLLCKPYLFFFFFLFRCPWNVNGSSDPAIGNLYHLTTAPYFSIYNDLPVVCRCDVGAILLRW